MAQKQYTTYQQDILSFELRDALLGIINPGRYKGFDSMSEYQTQAGNDVYCRISHSNGISKYDKQNIPVLEAVRGVAVSTQGTIIAEDGDVDVTITVSNDPSVTFHIIYMQHYYVEIQGVNPATYGVELGTPGAYLPTLSDSTRRVIIGVVIEDANTTDFNGLTYHPYHPGIGDDNLYELLFRDTLSARTTDPGTIGSYGVIGDRNFSSNEHLADNVSITFALSTLDSAIGSNDAQITALQQRRLDELGTPFDNTDLDATGSRHGLLPKLSNDSQEFLNGLGNWAVPVGAKIVMRTGTFSTDIQLTPSSADATLLDFSGIAPSDADVLILLLHMYNFSMPNYTECRCSFKISSGPGGYSGQISMQNYSGSSVTRSVRNQIHVPCNSSQQLYALLSNKTNMDYLNISLVGWQTYS